MAFHTKILAHEEANLPNRIDDELIQTTHFILCLNMKLIRRISGLSALASAILRILDARKNCPGQIRACMKQDVGQWKPRKATPHQQADG